MDWGFVQNALPRIHAAEVALPEELAFFVEYDKDGGFYHFPDPDSAPRSCDKAYSTLCELLKKDGHRFEIKTIKVTWE
jgi:hypothetical protein